MTRSYKKEHIIKVEVEDIGKEQKDLGMKYK